MPGSQRFEVPNSVLSHKRHAERRATIMPGKLPDERLHAVQPYPWPDFAWPVSIRSPTVALRPSIGPRFSTVVI